jgi:hypothetical protein
MIANHILVINLKSAKAPGRTLAAQLIALAQSMVTYQRWCLLWRMSPLMVQNGTPAALRYIRI